MRHLILLASLFSLWATSAVAQDMRVPVFFSATSKDGIGQQLVFDVSDDIKGSPSFREVYTQTEASFVVEFITMDPNNTSQSAVYSYVISIANRSGGLNYFYTSYVGVCGKEVLMSCANSIYGALGQELESIRQVLRSSPRE